MAIWNPYVMLREPVWCFNQTEAKKEGMQDCFAMIRLSDHRIVIDLESALKNHVEDCALEILAHEIGHHVLIPANRYDNAGLFKRMRLGLAGIEDRAPLVANLYSDLIINDCLQRIHGLNMAQIYEKIQIGNDLTSPLFQWYMRTYEYLWSLPRTTISGKKQSPQIDADASLAASLVRSYARDWLAGAGRFAMLAYPYLIAENEHNQARKELRIFLDAEKAGEGAEVSGGMAQIDEGILDDIVDPRNEVLDNAQQKENATTKKKNSNFTPESSQNGGDGPRQQYMSPGVYIDLMRQVDPAADENKLINRYYRDIAMPWLIPFPVDESSPLSELLPEGTDLWEPGDPIEEIDWFETTTASTVIIPGLTTRSRVYGEDQDASVNPSPFNLYIGIDCSGSMRNPRHNFSWPVCAGTIMALSALRARARVMCCLSGEPGGYLETEGFSKNENEVLTVLTSYIGSGYAYGIPRLQSPFLQKSKEKTHLLIVSDDDIFSMLSAQAPDKRINYEVAEEALHRAEGGGTFVLHSRRQWRTEEIERLKKMGWHIHFVTNEAEMVAFARAFAHQHYNKSRKTGT